MNLSIILYLYKKGLTKNDNTEGGTNDSQCPATPSEHVQGDGKSVVDQDVAQQDGAEEEVPHPSYWHNGLVR